MVEVGEDLDFLFGLEAHKGDGARGQQEEGGVDGLGLGVEGHG